MAVQTSYSIYTNRAYVGQLADLQNHEIVSKLAETSAIPFGVVVSRGTEDDQCVIGGADYLGIALRDLAREGARDAAATVQYLVTEAVSVLKRGWVFAAAPAGATAADAVKYNTTTGVLGAGAPGAGEAVVPGATWEETLAAGVIGKIRLNGVNPTVSGS